MRWLSFLSYKLNKKKTHNKQRKSHLIVEADWTEFRGTVTSLWDLMNAGNKSSRINHSSNVEKHSCVLLHSKNSFIFFDGCKLRRLYHVRVSAKYT